MLLEKLKTSSASQRFNTSETQRFNRDLDKLRAAAARWQPLFDENANPIDYFAKVMETEEGAYQAYSHSSAHRPTRVTMRDVQAELRKIDIKATILNAPKPIYATPVQRVPHPTNNDPAPTNRRFRAPSPYTTSVKTPTEGEVRNFTTKRLSDGFYPKRTIGGGQRARTLLNIVHYTKLVREFCDINTWKQLLEWNAAQISNIIATERLQSTPIGNIDKCCAEQPGLIAVATRDKIVEWLDNNEFYIEVAWGQLADWQGYWYGIPTHRPYLYLKPTTPGAHGATRRNISIYWPHLVWLASLDKCKEVVVG